MKPLIKLLSVFALALVLINSAFAGVKFNLDAPLDCSHYVAGGGEAVKYEIRSINYDTGMVRFQLLDSAGNYLGSGAVFGITLPIDGVDQDNVKAAIVAEVQSKN